MDALVHQTGRWCRRDMLEPGSWPHLHHSGHSTRLDTCICVLPPVEPLLSDCDGGPAFLAGGGPDGPPPAYLYMGQAGGWLGLYFLGPTLLRILLHIYT